MRFYILLVFGLVVCYGIIPITNLLLQTTRSSWNKWWYSEYSDFVLWKEKHNGKNPQTSGDMEESRCALWLEDTLRIADLGDLSLDKMQLLLSIENTDINKETIEKATEKESVIAAKYSTNSISIGMKWVVWLFSSLIMAIFIFASGDKPLALSIVLMLAVSCVISEIISDILCRTVPTLSAICLATIALIFDGLAFGAPGVLDSIVFTIIALILISMATHLLSLFKITGVVGKGDLEFFAIICIFLGSNIITFGVCVAIALGLIIIFSIYLRLRSSAKNNLIPLIPFLSVGLIVGIFLQVV